MQAKRQLHVNSAEYIAAQAAAAVSSAAALAASSAAPLHSENEWNISVVGAACMTVAPRGVSV
jgi:hypothetical protein